VGNAVITIITSIRHAKIGENNNGGEMAGHTLKTIDSKIPFKAYMLPEESS